MPPRAKPLKPKGKGPAQANERQVGDRSRGALLGLAVGEALAASTAGRNLVSPMFPTLCDGPHVEMTGGGPQQLKRGQTADATAQAVCLAEGLKEHLAYDLEATGKAYAKWLPLAFTPVESTHKALTEVGEGRHPEFVGKRVWLELHQKPADSTPLARVAPLGVFFSKDRDARIAATLADCSITHFAPLCQIACATLNGLIAAAIQSPKERIEPDDLKKVAEAELSLAASTLGRANPDWVLTVKDSADWLREDFKFGQAEDPELYGPELHLFSKALHVRTAYRLAMWELFHAPSFEAGLLDVVNRGGAADLNAAIVGALLGAVFGEAAIPELWRTEVLECVPRGDGALNSRYHPRFLMTLAGVTPAPKPPKG